MKMQIGLEQELSQKLTQHQMLSLHILSYDNVELEQFLQDEFVENPLLEYTPGSCHSGLGSGNAGTDTLERIRECREEEKPLDKVAFFMEQLKRENYSSKQWKVMEYLCNYISDSGFLEISMEEVAEKLKLSEEFCETCRQILMTLEPVGVFSGSLSECLLIQMEKAGEEEMVKRIARDYLEEVAECKIAFISRGLGVSTEQVRKYINRIKRYNPRPLGGVSGEMAEYIVPDVLCEEEDEGWRLRLNDRWIEDYSLNDYYIKMIKTVEDASLKSYFQEKYNRVCSIMSGIQQRRETILRISRSIVNRQMDYFKERGELHGMTMQDIADDTGVHVSTVSRAIKGKYIQYKGGTVLLRNLFTYSATFHNQEVTVASIKARIREVISKENGREPYSDRKISEILEKENITISRRTVAKYREELNIPKTYERRML